METRCGGDFLKHVKVILMKSPNNERDGVLTGQMLPLKEALSAGTGLYPMELLAIAVPRAVTKWKDCSPQTDSKHPRQKTIPTQLIDRGEVELLPTSNLHVYILVSLEGTLRLPREKHKHQASHKSFDLQCCTFCQVC